MKERILSLLETTRGASGAFLATKLSIPRQAIHKHILALIRSGRVIWHHPQRALQVDGSGYVSPAPIGFLKNADAALVRGEQGAETSRDRPAFDMNGTLP